MQPPCCGDAALAAWMLAGVLFDVDRYGRMAALVSKSVQPGEVHLAMLRP